MVNEEAARQIGRRVIEDATKLRKFMPECIAKFPVLVEDMVFEVQIHPKEQEKER